MQRNPGVITIEELLLKALLDADAISQENFEQPQSMAFQRTARTDKGVHAAGEISCDPPLSLSISIVLSHADVRSLSMTSLH